MPEAILPPAYVLPLLLPPLLFAAAQRSSVRDFISNAWALIALALVLVVVNVVTVAFVARTIDPAVPLVAAVVLGAVVAPPDPVAATSVAGRLGLPKRLVDILEGEGLLNDATTLVIYSVALAAAATGGSERAGGWTVLLTSVLLAPAIGVAFSWLAVRLLDRLADPRAEVAITIVLPYAAYLVMEAVGGSGVLAVVVAGVLIGQRGGGAFSSYGFLAGSTLWAFADWLVSGVAFALIGFELAEVLRSPDVGWYGIGVAAGTCVVVVVVRALYVLPLDWLARHTPFLRAGPHSWREATVVAWAGMRGVVTLATTLALPADFPARPVIVLSGIAVVLVTLLGQGLTLPWIIRRLGVTGEPAGPAEVSELRTRAAQAALRRLDELCAQGEVQPENEQTLRGVYERMLPSRLSDLPEGERDQLHDLREVGAELRTAERETVLALRRTGETSSAAATTVLRDIEARETFQARRRPGGSLGPELAEDD